MLMLVKMRDWTDRNATEITFCHQRIALQKMEHLIAATYQSSSSDLTKRSGAVIGEKELIEAVLINKGGRWFPEKFLGQVLVAASWTGNMEPTVIWFDW